MLDASSDLLVMDIPEAVPGMPKEGGRHVDDLNLGGNRRSKPRPAGIILILLESGTLGLFRLLVGFGAATHATVWLQYRILQFT